MSQTKPYDVIVLGFDGVLGSVLLGALDLFSFTGVSWQRFLNLEVKPRFNVQIASLGGGDITASNRLVIQAHCDISTVSKCDLLLIPTIGDSIDKVLKNNSKLLPHLQRLSATKADIASNCSGAFFWLRQDCSMAKPQPPIGDTPTNSKMTTHWLICKTTSLSLSPAIYFVRREAVLFMI